MRVHIITLLYAKLFHDVTFTHLDDIEFCDIITHQHCAPRLSLARADNFWTQFARSTIKNGRIFAFSILAALTSYPQCGRISVRAA